jgi:murein DD-endopeptidase MepM/ murein hydrolase activator NlpD
MPRAVTRGARLLIAALLALPVAGGGAPARAQPHGEHGEAGGRALRFPTDNEAILDAEPARFYMGLERHFGRERMWSWEGGTYGYVREARETPAGWRFTRFHEGVDVAPLRRDADGEPLDAVYAVDAGRVVYVNARAGGSDYGRYVVVEHVWDGSPFYTLYAHLAETAVAEGERVRRGERLGTLGYSGNGLDRARAHLHFEVNLLLNAHFSVWRDARHPRWRAAHGRYHGTNLAGVSPVRVLLRSRSDAGSAVASLLADEEEDVTVYVPGGPPPDLLERYPWLCRACDGAPPPARGRSWEVGLTRSGLPVRVEPAERLVGGVRLAHVSPDLAADYQASRMLTHAGPGAELSDAALNLLTLLFTRADYIPAW